MRLVDSVQTPLFMLTIAGKEPILKEYILLDIYTKRPDIRKIYNLAFIPHIATVCSISYSYCTFANDEQDDMAIVLPEHQELDIPEYTPIGIKYINQTSLTKKYPYRHVITRESNVATSLAAVILDPDNKDNLPAIGKTTTRKRTHSNDNGSLPRAKKN
ncbi:hypothetical protein CcNV_007 [Crangon crangon nudivirus]|uniref:Uncharacterized protein n=1 Tax=Crangon crangon nudivirus TaxID=2880838 RepID=A0AAE8XZS8_9VIRU|nr:hypothetical protein QKT25_gp007 [Crangon crangon nudivirus]UBZ25491.1 hypothetical protein CcNV_007 [Crangon crangon nudivirus]